MMSSFERFSSESEGRRDIPSFIEARPPIVTGPGQRPRPQQATNLMDLYESESILEDDVVQVYLRMKPCNEINTLYDIRSDKVLVTSGEAMADYGRRTQFHGAKQHRFTHIFKADATQKEVFDHVVKDNLSKLLEGHSFTLLTYGASGSGKTYTLMGNKDNPGLVPRSLEYIFKLASPAQHPLYRPRDGSHEMLNSAAQASELELVSRLRKAILPSRLAARREYRRMSQRLTNDFNSLKSLASRHNHYIWVSFIEIYNEAVYDLLVPPNRSRLANQNAAKLKIYEDPNGTAYVKGATQAFVRTGTEAYDVMAAGQQNMRVAATGVHAHSSRSHCIFTITLINQIPDGGVEMTYVRLCDLAGSERADRTQNAGVRMAESRAINSSLHVLERCLHALRRKQRANTTLGLQVPIRQSKLTRLLGAPLQGMSREAVSMVVTVNPSALYAQETRHVLQLAAVASDILVNTLPAEITTVESSCRDSSDYDAEMLTLRAENERLQFEMCRLYDRLELMDREAAWSREENAATMRELVDTAKETERRYHTQQMSLLERRLLREKETLRQELEARIQELLLENTRLKEQLNQRPLQMAVLEREVEHLHACLEERDQAASPEADEPQQQERNEQQEKAVPEVVISDDSDSSFDSGSEDEGLETISEEDSQPASLRNTMEVKQYGRNSSAIAEEVDERRNISDEITNGKPGRETYVVQQGAQHGSDSEDEIVINNSASNTSNKMSTASGPRVRASIDDSNRDSTHEHSTSAINDPDVVESAGEDRESGHGAVDIHEAVTISEVMDDSNVHEIVTGGEIVTVNSSSLLTSCKGNPDRVEPVLTMPPPVVPKPSKDDSFACAQKSFTLDSITLTHITEHPTIDDTKTKQKNFFTNPVEIVLTEHKPTGNSADNSSTCEPSLTITQKSLCDTNDFLQHFTKIPTDTEITVTNAMRTENHAENKNELEGILSICRPKSEATFFQDERKSIEFACRKTFNVAEQVMRKHKSSIDFERRHEVSYANDVQPIDTTEDKIPPYNAAHLMDTSENGHVEKHADEPLHLNCETEKHEDIQVADYQIYIKPDKKVSLSILPTVMGSIDFHTNTSETKEKNSLKKSLRLRKKQTNSEISRHCENPKSKPESKEKILKVNLERFRDIVNLQKEFSDITLGVPSTKKEVPDIPSPEKTGEENTPPQTAMTCPTKITRSRRKLFTPRADTLDDSVVSDDDGNTRVRVQRPSYRRPLTRARRKL